MRTTLTMLSASLILASAAAAADWPQWLGPHRDGSTSEKVSPWKEPLQPAWKKQVGQGHSSPIVADGALYLHTKVQDMDQERVQAFDALTGELKWEKTYARARFKPLFGEGPRATPCVAGGKLFTYGITGVLCCWNAADGALLWEKDLLKEFDEGNLFFGVSCSPIVIDDLVIVMVGKGKTGAAALRVKDGSTAWTAGGDPASYSSPISIKEGRHPQLVFLTGAHVMGISPKGDLLWKFPFVDALSESSTTPVKVDDLIVVSSVKAGAVGLKLMDQQGKSDVMQAWKNPDLTCYFSTPVAVDKAHLYMVTGVASLTKASITLRCVETATGTEVWNRPGIGKYHAALLKLGEGKLLLHEDNGNLALLAPDVKQYQELARSKVCGETWAHPAIANGYLYVRGEQQLFAYKLPRD